MKKVISTVRSVFIYPIRFYQRHISPRRPACCKYYPTCSQYAITAIQRFGVTVGGFLALWRILRCNPWSKGGIDPVPERLFSKKSKEK